MLDNLRYRRVTILSHLPIPAQEKQKSFDFQQSSRQIFVPNSLVAISKRTNANNVYITAISCLFL